MIFFEYNNPTWEPAFSLISPFWDRIYRATKIGLVRWIAASMIFKKMSRLERDR